MKRQRALPSREFGKTRQESFKTDRDGNDLTPEQTEIKDYYGVLAKSSTGETVEPYAIYLTAGEHTVALENPGQAVAVAELILEAPEAVSDYSDYSKGFKEDKSTSAETIVIEGESARFKIRFKPYSEIRQLKRGNDSEQPEPYKA